MLVDSLAYSLEQSPGVRHTLGPSTAEAAVAIVIRPDNGVLFIRRAVHPDDPWSGHIALPGGRVDPMDSGLQGTAEREVQEEVGVMLTGARCLGMLNPVTSPEGVPRIVVVPFVFVLDSAPRIQMDPREVVEVHWFGLDRLLSGEGRGTFSYRYQGVDHVLPRLDLDGARVWGMTLRIVDEVIDRLQPRS